MHWAKSAVVPLQAAEVVAGIWLLSAGEKQWILPSQSQVQASPMCQRTAQWIHLNLMVWFGGGALDWNLRMCECIVFSKRNF